MTTRSYRAVRKGSLTPHFSSLSPRLWASGPSALPCAGAAPPQRPALASHRTGSSPPSWHAHSAPQPTWRLPTEYAITKTDWRRRRRVGQDTHFMRPSSYLKPKTKTAKKKPPPLHPPPAPPPRSPPAPDCAPGTRPVQTVQTRPGTASRPPRPRLPAALPRRRPRPSR